MRITDYGYPVNLLGRYITLGYLDDQVLTTVNKFMWKYGWQASPLIEILIEAQELWYGTTL